jgi:DNA-binding NarL/FixJ family response regulator
VASVGPRDVRSDGLKFDSLTQREREVLSLIVAGKTLPEIASLLFVAPTTIKTHKVSIMRKLNVNKAMDLLKFAVRNGIIKL